MQVYLSVAEPLVDAVLDGFNAAVLCYGQTGSGKSYTMLGDESAAAERGPCQPEHRVSASWARTLKR